MQKQLRQKMGRWIGRMGGMALGGAIAGATLAVGQQPAQAQAAYGSYIGWGGSVGLPSDNTGRGSSFSGVIAGRYRFLEAPVSIRAQGFVGGGNFAFVPTVSYDFPLNWNTDLYVGAGVSLVTGNGTQPSSVGDRSAFVIQPGIDYLMPNSNVVLFGNAVIAFGAYRNGGSPAVAIQGGVGYQF